MTSDLTPAIAAMLPPAIAGRLSQRRWQRDTLGRSTAQIFRLVAEGQPDLFLKFQPMGPFDELPREAARTRWLAAQDISCPEVLALERHEGHDWLLSGAVAGRDLASATELDATARITLVAEGLQRLHAIDPRTCPFDQRLAARLVEAGARVAASRVDEADFDAERKGMSASALLERMCAEQLPEVDPVVTHGDASFPNIMARDGQFGGFVDLGRLGVADRYQDIALAVWSVRYNLGPEWVRPFLDRYGIASADRERLAYYKALDEFF